METGTVKFFDLEKGYGFIKPSKGGKDLFVHVSGVVGKMPLEQNMAVEYNVGQGKKGPCAVDVKTVQ